MFSLEKSINHYWNHPCDDLGSSCYPLQARARTVGMQKCGTDQGTHGDSAGGGRWSPELCSSPHHTSVNRTTEDGTATKQTFRLRASLWLDSRKLDSCSLSEKIMIAFGKLSALTPSVTNPQLNEPERNTRCWDGGWSRYRAPRRRLPSH